VAFTPSTTSLRLAVPLPILFENREELQVSLVLSVA